MLRSRLSLLWLVPALMLLMAFRQVPLQDPAPLAVPAKLTMVQVAKAVKQALVKREWLINSDQPGKLTATYARRDFSVQIGIAYDRQQVQITYLGSSNLKYEVKNGRRWIHKNYQSWIQNLETDISGNMAMENF